MDKGAKNLTSDYPNPALSINVVMQIAYDGTNYFGWQKTKTGPSIEEGLEGALTKVLQHTVSLQAASRTDRGVHAHGQVVNFTTTKSLHLPSLKRSLNQLLPDDIRVLSVDAMPLEFHPTLSAKSKEYHYHLVYDKELMPHLRYTHWHNPAPLDIEAMRQAAVHCVGTNDFKSFCNQRNNLSYETTVRSLTKLTICELEEKRLRIELEGNHFLYKMARNLVGTLVYVGRHLIQAESITEILQSKKRELAGPTAPAQGLTLYKVYY